MLLPPSLTITVGGIDTGFRHAEERLAVITDDEIFGPRTHRRARRRDRRVFESSLADLRPGHHVVHADYGIARYHGLLHLKAGGTEGDYLHLEFAGDDRLYLPVERIEKVQKYVADGGEPRLDKMGSGSWEKAKLKARAAVEELARDLLHIQANASWPRASATRRPMRSTANSRPPSPTKRPRISSRRSRRSWPTCSRESRWTG